MAKANLTRFLESQPEGPIDDHAELERLLSAAWSCFEGSDRGGMASYKLIGRTEGPKWDPPDLTITIERHGGTAQGSTRAELQDWILNVSTWSASYQGVRYRQVNPRQPRLDVKDIAERIAIEILERRCTDYLKWFDDGRIQVKIGIVLPKGSAFVRTITGRRNRFKVRLNEVLQQNGWQHIGRYIFAPPSTSNH